MSQKRMRRVPLSQFKVAATHPIVGGQTVTYADVIQSRIGSAPAQGMNITQMSMALALCDAVRAASEAGHDHVLLPEQQWATLVERLNEGGWTLVDQGILDMVAAIQDAPSVAPDAAAAEAAA